MDDCAIEVSIERPACRAACIFLRLKDAKEVGAPDVAGLNCVYEVDAPSRGLELDEAREVGS